MNDLSPRPQTSRLYTFHSCSSITPSLQLSATIGTTGFNPPASGVEPTAQHQCKSEKIPHEGMPVARGVDDEAAPYSLRDSVSLKPVHDSTHRKLKSRHMQLTGIGRAISEWIRGGVEGVPWLERLCSEVVVEDRD